MTKLGKYEILEEIGRGGFATVYKARDTTLDRIIALKVLHHHVADDPAFIQRFYQEARMAARLHHSNVATVYEVGEEAGQHYLAMTFLPGQTLDAILESARELLPLEQTISIVEQVAGALDDIHGQGLVHRDVKPSNIIVDDAGQATLLDFGIARAADGTQLTTTGTVMGTPQYMSPEQAEIEKAADIDWRADIYALGVVAYEMMVGRPPFTGRSSAAILHKHVYERPPAPSTLNPELPARLEPVLLKVLAKDREKRFQAAGEFTATLLGEWQHPEQLNDTTETTGTTVSGGGAMDNAAGGPDYIYSTPTAFERRLVSLREELGLIVQERESAKEMRLEGSAKAADAEMRSIQKQIQILKNRIEIVKQGYEFWDKVPFEFACEACHFQFRWYCLGYVREDGEFMPDDDLPIRVPLEAQRALKAAIDSRLFERFLLCEALDYPVEAIDLERDDYTEMIPGCTYYLFGCSSWDDHFGISQWYESSFRSVL